MVKRVAAVWTLALGTAVSVNAQSSASESSTARSHTATAQSSSAEPAALRPATTTFDGDTGLWFVPTADVLAHGKWAASGYRRGTNFIQGFSNVSDIAATFGVGIKNRAEVFGSFIVNTRIDRDLRPLFIGNQTVGGIIDRYPHVDRSWTGNAVGDVSLGAKVNLWSASRQKPLSLAARGLVKLPSGDKEAGVSTGKADGIVDLVVSKEMRSHVEVAGYAGYQGWGQADELDGPSGAFRWGAGAGFPTRSPVRGVFEVNGLVPGSSTISRPISQVLTAIDGSIAPITSAVQTITRATAALTWQHRNGLFIGGGVSWNLPSKNRGGFTADSDPSGVSDFGDWQIRLGFRFRGRELVASPPPPPPAAATPEPRAPEARAPAPLAPAPTRPPASGRVNIQVVHPPTRAYAFEDVLFELDRYALSPEAIQLLDQAVAALNADDRLRLDVEGHTCNIATAEYNLALGHRRATAVRDYLVSRGVSADRLRTISYGEERPKHDNEHEETRRLNRRATLVVNRAR